MLQKFFKRHFALKKPKITVEDPKVVEELRNLPVKYLDKNKHPKGIEFDQEKRVRVAKSRAFRSGMPTPLYSELPGQRPEDHLMHLIIEDGPQTRNEIWENAKNKGFLQSRKHLKESLRHLLKKELIFNKIVKTERCFKYSFNNEKADDWNKYVKDVYQQRFILLQLIRRRMGISPPAVLSTGEKNSSSEKLNSKELGESNNEATTESSFSQTAERYFTKDKLASLEEECYKFVDVEKLTKSAEKFELECSKQEKDLTMPEAEKREETDEKRDEEWEETLSHGVGFVYKGTRDKRLGNLYFKRKKLKQSLLGKTGPPPKSRKRTLLYFQQKKREREVVKQIVYGKNKDNAKT